MTTKTTKVQPITQHDDTPIASGEGSSVLHVSEMGRDILVVVITEYKGKRALDLRRYYMDDDQQQWRPTSKGIRVPIQDAEALIIKLSDLRHAGVFA